MTVILLEAFSHLYACKSLYQMANVSLFQEAYRNTCGTYISNYKQKEKSEIYEGTLLYIYDRYNLPLRWRWKANKSTSSALSEIYKIKIKEIIIKKKNNDDFYVRIHTGGVCGLLLVVAL